jgi:hypothetical protein
LRRKHDLLLSIGGVGETLAASIDLFRESFLTLKRDAAPGVDDMTWKISRQTASVYGAVAAS